MEELCLWLVWTSLSIHTHTKGVFRGVLRAAVAVGEGGGCESLFCTTDLWSKFSGRKPLAQIRLWCSDLASSFSMQQQVLVLPRMLGCVHPSLGPQQPSSELWVPAAAGFQYLDVV